MWNLENDGIINDRLPGDFDKALKNKIWVCSKCGNTIPSESKDVFYVRSSDFVYHRDSDGHLYPCEEEGGLRFVGDIYWKKPLKLNDEVVTIKKPVNNIE